MVFVGAEGVVEDFFVEAEVGDGGWGLLGFGGLGGGGEEGHQVIEDVIAIDDEFGALLDEAVATEGGGFVDGAGDGVDGAAGFDGLLGGDEGTAAAGGFDDEEAAAPTGDDAVSVGEGLFIGEAVDGILADDGAVFGDAFGEGLVFGGVEFADAGADDGDGAAFGGEGGFVGGGVDAAGEAADDGVAGVGDLEAEFFGGGEAVVGGLAAADDADGVVVAFGEGAPDVEEKGGAGGLAEEVGVEFVFLGEQGQLVVGDFAEFAEEVDLVFPVGDGVGEFLVEAVDGGDLGGFGAEGVFRGAEVVDEFAEAHRADVGDEVDGQVGLGAGHCDCGLGILGTIDLGWCGGGLGRCGGRFR